MHDASIIGNDKYILIEQSPCGISILIEMSVICMHRCDKATYSYILTKK